MFKRIAILILAHKGVPQINRLLEHLSQGFDLYVHLDKKSKITEKEVYSVPNITLIKRLPVYWGSFNQILATVELLRLAERNRYDRYILISGQDLPIVSNSMLAQFFGDKEEDFVECYRLPCEFWNGGGINRVTRYYTNSAKGIKGLYRRFLSAQDGIVSFIGKTFDITRPIDLNFYGGSNWFNITGQSASLILEKIDRDPIYLRRFRNTRMADEIFLQTVLNAIGGEVKINNSSLRYIDFASGPEFPRILRMIDFEKITRSGMLFARKFDFDVDRDICELVYERIRK